MRPALQLVALPPVLHLQKALASVAVAAVVE
jgi:hypothetical protein